MIDYNTQIVIFSYLPVQDISNVLITSKNAYYGKNTIMRDIWCERYPGLYNKMDHTITNMFYVDMVFQFLDGYDLKDMMLKLNLNGLMDDCDTREEYCERKIKVNKFSLVVGRLQRTYDLIHDILMVKLKKYEDDDEDYGDEEDLEMFAYSLMEYGPAMYSKIMLSDEPYIQVIDDDMADERSIGICFEEEQYDDNAKVEDIDMIELTSEIIYNRMDDGILEELEAMEDDYDDIDEYEYECEQYGVVPDWLYDNQGIEIDRMEDMLDEDPVETIHNLLDKIKEHPDLLDSIKEGILNYMDELMPHTIRKLME